MVWAAYPHKVRGGGRGLTHRPSIAESFAITRIARPFLFHAMALRLHNAYKNILCLLKIGKGILLFVFVGRFVVRGVVFCYVLFGS